jgi:glycogen synthase
MSYNHGMTKIDGTGLSGFISAISALSLASILNIIRYSKSNGQCEMYIHKHFKLDPLEGKLANSLRKEQESLRICGYFRTGTMVPLIGVIGHTHRYFHKSP